MTLVFAAVLALVLGATGLVIYRAFRSDLNGSEDRALRSRSEELAALVRRSNARIVPSLANVGSTEDDFAQVLSADGRVLAATPQVPGGAVLAGAALEKARRGQIVLERAPLPQLDGRVRIRAVPVHSPLGNVIVVVGTALGERDEQLSNLALRLALGGAAALVLVALAGYGVATAALRPVEAMRRRAASILPGERQRLPVARSHDEIARLGETLNEMLDRLQAAFIRERVFVADASHQLRTPLSVLKAEIELAMRRGRSAAELREALESAAEETDRLVRLAEDLLVLARLDQGRLPLRTEAVDLDPLLETVVERAQPRAQELGVRLDVDAAGERAQGDPARIEQALENMLDNAVRFAGSSVRLRAVARGARVELHVIDDGRGFEPEILAQAFERFRRGSGRRARGGAGLGLAIVAAVAQAHGGAARAANLPGGGADVWIELPRAPARSPTAAVRVA